MPVIDSQGRVFGRWNLVDALLVILLVMAIPAGYGAHFMFRDPPARLVAVLPSVINQGPDQQVEIRGENLRPYMRISFGGIQGSAFMYYGPTQAFVPLPVLAPGQYDVVLYDYMREVGRLPAALTITGPARPPAVQVLVTGAFTGQQPNQLPRLTVGQTLYSLGGLTSVIMALGEPRPSIASVRVSDAIRVPVTIAELQEVPATLVVTCPTELAPDGIFRCSAGGIVLAPDVNIVLRGPDNQVPFRIDRLENVPAKPR